MVNRNARFAWFMDITKRFEERKVIIFADSDTSVDLRVSQMPGSPKVAIVILTTYNRQIDYFTPCAYAWGNNVRNYFAVQCTYTWNNYCWT